MNAPMNGPIPDIDARRASRNFSSAAATYERSAQLQAQTRDHLLTMLDALALPASAPAARRFVDLGCGTGLGALALRGRDPEAQILALDRADGMVRAAQAAGVGACLVADAQALPLPTAGVDLLFSNLVLQWCPQPERALAEARRVLRPGGVLLMSVPGPATLRELRRAWQQIDDAEHIHQFTPQSVWIAWAEAAGFAADKSERLIYRPVYRDLTALMQSLRDIGARNVSAGGRRGLLGKSALARLHEAYAPWRRHDGVFASWEILYLQLRVPA